jgi:hypothetical protein
LKNDNSIFPVAHATALEVTLDSPFSPNPHFLSSKPWPILIFAGQITESFYSVLPAWTPPWSRHLSLDFPMYQVIGIPGLSGHMSPFRSFSITQHSHLVKTKVRFWFSVFLGPFHALPFHSELKPKAT